MENKNEDENQLVINDINSLNSGKNTAKSPFSWKKIFLFGAIICFIIIIIIILIIFLSKKSKSSDEEKERPDIGKIICTYEPMSDGKILGDDFIKISDFDIYINGTKMKYSKIYDLALYGTDKVEIRVIQEGDDGQLRRVEITDYFVKEDNSDDVLVVSLNRNM